jgi:hypothetical protein
MVDRQAHHVHSRCAIVPGAVTVNMKVNCAPAQFPPSEKDGGRADATIRPVHGSTSRRGCVIQEIPEHLSGRLVHWKEEFDPNFLKGHVTGRPKRSNGSKQAK